MLEATVDFLHLETSVALYHNYYLDINFLTNYIINHYKTFIIIINIIFYYS